MDIPLTDLGKGQAEHAAGYIEQHAGDVAWIVASAMLRVQQTAAIVAAHLKLPVTTDTRLNERRLGDWNGRLIADTESLLRQGLTPPGGESNAELNARVGAWLEDWRPHLGEPGLIVASKGIGRVLCEQLIGRNITLGNCDLLLFEGSTEGNRVSTVSAGRPWGQG